MSRPDPRAMAAFQKAAERAVADAGEFLLEQANRTVPIEEATLERSGQTTSATEGQTIRSVISYDTPYAARQHEDTRLRHNPGRRAKWLEQTLAEEARSVGEFVADELRAFA